MKEKVVSEEQIKEAMVAVRAEAKANGTFDHFVIDKAFDLLLKKLTLQS